MPDIPIDPDDQFDTEGPPQDVDDLDDEMKGLLGELDETDEYLTGRMVAEVPGVDGDASPPIEMAPNPAADKLDEPPATPPQTSEVRRLDILPQLVTAEESTPPPPPPEPVVDIRKQFEQFDAIAEEVVQGTRHDRQETQDAINLCRGEIQKAINAGQNPSRMWVDNLTKALEIKATVNLTAIKALEAKAKLLAATKAGVQVQNNNLIQNTNVSAQADKSLVDLLNNNPLESSGDDEY
jgi:hypothetical protein